MTSFQLGIRANQRAAGRYIAHVRRSIQKALVEEQKKRGLTQSDIARELGIHRSIVSKELRGRKDISLGRVAEYAWALGREMLFELPVPRQEYGDNKSISAGSVRTVQIEIETAAPPQKNINVKITRSTAHIAASAHAQ